MTAQQRGKRMKYVIKGKNKNTNEVINCAEFRNKEPAQFFFKKLVEDFGKGNYDFWVESQPGTTKIVKNYKTKKREQGK